MAITLPPVPIGEKENSYLWNQWFLKLQQTLSGTDGVAWALIDKAGSNLTDLATRNHNNLQNISGGAVNDYYHLTSAQHTTLTGLPTLAAGTYTPTLTNVTNLDGSTAFQCQYMRVGATVTVSGKVSVDPTVGASTQLGISLPIASNIGAVEDVGGAAFSPTVANQGAAIVGDAANDRAQMEWIAVNTTDQAMFFTFTYQII